MFPITDFLIYCFVTAYTPGVNNLLSMSNAMRLGFKKSFKFNLGITLGFLIVMSICALFSSILFTMLPKIKFYMQILGAIYMLHLAQKMWKSNSDFQVEEEAASFLAGMVLQFINPKIYIYAITAMSLYILPVFHSNASLIGFTLLLTIIGASGSFMWALFGTIFCKIFIKHTKIVNLIMALLLVYCAIALFL
ncbi:lysine transporter LysE [Helicobacter valdiviensis]|uniref:Lysine transporter LysE n=1 Tax=Helicobacter valdiviensis TaxID=1458358 RepID=A0A2W6MXN6_9HELI|nr:LysE family transporter [Helicobacter valdiviensis]PZT49147.1 lysine transporter LysE [Helicobacter valdiviensis]